jgi:hypothetical protein
LLASESRDFKADRRPEDYSRAKSHAILVGSTRSNAGKDIQ